MGAQDVSQAQDPLRSQSLSAAVGVLCSSELQGSQRGHLVAPPGHFQRGGPGGKSQPRQNAGLGMEGTGVPSIQCSAVCAIASEWRGPFTRTSKGHRPPSSYRRVGPGGVKPAVLT